MANTYSCLYLHIVFSTKYRKRRILKDFENEVWDYIDGIARNNDIRPIKTGGIEDHLHSLLNPPARYSVSDVSRIIKSGSSGWIKRKFDRQFSWQDGYAAFSVSQSVVPRVIDYIKNQRIHHQNKSFEQEYKDLLDIHGVDISDETYMFG